VHLRLRIGEHDLDLHGTVVRVVDAAEGGLPGLGVEFESLSPGQAMILEAVVAGRPKRRR
jgi:hypothetical protein